MKNRKGFTLVELIVAMAILFILIYMSFAAFTYITAFSRSSTQREAVQENLSTVLDQVTKELRQTVNNAAEPDPKGITCPSSSGTRDILSVLSDTSPQPGSLGPNDYYIFDISKGPILMFYMYDSDNPNTKHRITYTLGVPNDGSGYSPPHYTGIAKNYWVSQSYEPCQILYSNETWNGSAWVGVANQPITDQVITNFAAIRPAWSDKAVQIVIEAMVKTPTGISSSKITLIAQVTLRQ
jgi:prepilin-type N-terminal cleavage/methylation domain-containing protein